MRRMVLEIEKAKCGDGEITVTTTFRAEEGESSSDTMPLAVEPGEFLSSL